MAVAVAVPPVIARSSKSIQYSVLIVSPVTTQDKLNGTRWVAIAASKGTAGPPVQALLPVNAAPFVGAVPVPYFKRSRAPSFIVEFATAPEIVIVTVPLLVGVILEGVASAPSPIMTPVVLVVPVGSAGPTFNTAAGPGVDIILQHGAPGPVVSC